MPSTSKSQQALFAIAEHHPDKLYARNRKVATSMTHEQLHDFASTPTKDLPERAGTGAKKKGHGAAYGGSPL
jgi:hypothetical protein